MAHTCWKNNTRARKQWGKHSGKTVFIEMKNEIPLGDSIDVRPEDNLHGYPHGGCVSTEEVIEILFRYHNLQQTRRFINSFYLADQLWDAYNAYCDQQAMNMIEWESSYDEYDYDYDDGGDDYEVHEPAFGLLLD